MRSLSAVAAVMVVTLLAPWCATAAETNIKFRGQDIWYQGADVKWIGEPTAGDAELLLIFKDPAAVKTFRTSYDVEARVLAVGGGGAGGTVRSSATTYTKHPGGGGGGAGELVDRSGVLFSQNVIYSIAVGNGGAATGVSGTASPGADGEESAITSAGGDVLRVKGGGGGGGESIGRNGGSGGGGSNDTADGGESEKNENDGQGNVGGISGKRCAGGGGGSKTIGGTGDDDAKGGDGGEGVESDIDPDNPKAYAGGGGGGCTNMNDPGEGKAGGGTGGKSKNETAAAPTAGQPNSGSGGGGGGRYMPGAAGGSGIVIIRVTFMYIPMVWKEISITAGGNEGVIFVNQNATVSKVGNDIVIVYSDVNQRGGLNFAPPNDEMRAKYPNNPPIWANARVLAVGGGGGGGMVNVRTDGGGAGGGAGGFVETSGLVFDNTVEFSISVGKGGAGGAANEKCGENGADSSVTTNGLPVIGIAFGGGGGGAKTKGLDGGSGGGGSQAILKDESGSYARAGGEGVAGQGYAGGTGVDLYRGGGGGGAGGRGGDGSNELGAGSGGEGKASDITGSDLIYAAGGGGAFVNPNNTTMTKNLGGLGGGQEGDHRVGGNGAGVDGGADGKQLNPMPATNGMDGRGGGGGGGNSYDGADPEQYPAGNGGNGIVIIRLSGFVVNHVPYPTVVPQQPFTYDGELKRGVEEFYAYKLLGTPVATNSDVYTVRAWLDPNGPYTWPDGTKGEGAPLIWKIKPMPVDLPTWRSSMPPRPNYFVFGNEARNDEEQKLAVDPDIWRLASRAAYPGETCAAVNGNGLVLPYCTLTGHRETNASNYYFTATLVDKDPYGVNATNFIWKGDAETATVFARRVSWRIEQAENEIKTLALASWQEGLTNNVPTPSSTWQWSNVRTRHPESYPTEDKVTYQWRPEGAGDDAWSEPKVKEEFVPPTEYGPYEIRAYICKDSNHDFGNWKAAEKIIRFYIWRHPSKLLTDYVDWTFDSARSKPITVKLEEPTNSGRNGIAGFSYGRADPAELRFVALPTSDYNKRDEDRTNKWNDVLLAYTNVTWNTKGVSEVRVMLPSNTSISKFRMYWHRKTGAEVRPDILSREVMGTPAATKSNGLVSQMQSDGHPSWVNWWKTEPTLKRYWDINELTAQKVNSGHGALAQGTITNIFTKMPEAVPVDFPDTAKIGAYTVEFAMIDMENFPNAPYQGRHLLFDGTRIQDLEIVDHDPSPIDPDGPEGATFSGRVLTANDDTNATRAISLQSYWRTRDVDETTNPYWVHTDGPTLDLGMNLRPRAVHALRRTEADAEGGTVTNDLWVLHDVYIGNMMTNDAAATGNNVQLKSRWNTLPWSSTSLAISAKDAPFDHTEVGQLVMRNLGGTKGMDDGGAAITSGVFTNGVGTIYFDAVNAYAMSDLKSAQYKLVVEYDDPMVDGTNHWRTAAMTVLKINGSSVSQSKKDAEELELDIKNAGKVTSFQFYRVYAKLDRREPTRVRIRRTGVRTDAGGIPTSEDDPDGFILVDNVIVSWPAPVPRLVPTGSYDASRLRAKAPVLGTEGAFSTAYPSVGQTLFANVRLEGGVATNVASARMKYRWRYADTEFIPARQNGRDVWGIGYFNVTGETFSTTAPLAVGDLPGDFEYWFDLTAFVPYYTYIDYTGLVLAKPVNGYSEEPEKNMPSAAKPVEYTPDPCFPSHGTNWFVRLREWSSSTRGWWLHYKTSPAAPERRLALEMTDARAWRVCLPTKDPVAELQFRFVSEVQTGTDAQGVHLVTNLWAAESTTALPKRLLLRGGAAADEWATLPCDAKTGYLLFQVDEAKESVMVSRADWQDFNMWTSGVSTNGLFSGSSVDTNVTSYVAGESEADMAGWPVSVASPTNRPWQLDFSSPGQPAAVVYPRNEPFSSKFINGWTAENAMWTYGKWSLQNKNNPLQSTGDDSALQLTGRGYGRLSFTTAADSPDGLDTISYKARVAQYNEFDNFTYFDWAFGATIDDYVPSRNLQNYTFATCAALTAKEGGAALYDGDGSVSLVGYYNPEYGAYELRVSRSWSDRGVRLALYRWRSKNGAMTCEKLYDAGTEISGYKKNYFDFGDEEDVTKRNAANAQRIIKGAITPLAGLFISMKNGTDGSTLVTAGIRQDDVSVVTGMEGQSGQQYACIVYKDTSAERLTKGTFGVLACNCPGVFAKPIVWKNGLDNTKPSKDNVLEMKDKETITFTGDIEAATCRNYDHWVIRPERTEKLVSQNGYFGFQAKTPPPQKVVVQVAESGTSDWKDVYTNTVNGFTSDSYRNVVRDSRKCSVRLQSLGGPDDVRVDVVLDDLELTQWNGQWTEKYDANYEPWFNLTNSFVYTSAWIVEGADGSKAVKLQPTRARKDTKTGAYVPVSLRSSLLRGLGLVHFKWRNADPHAKLRVQYKENVSLYSIVNATDTLASDVKETGDGWVDCETIPVGEIGRSGSKSVYINRRYGKTGGDYNYLFGLIRIVVDEDVEVEAATPDRRRNDPEYGSVEITEAFAWDLPEYDKHSWSGWNFRTAGWNGADPDPYANIEDGFRGLSALLNNTLDEDSLADREKGHYNQRLPGIQSPTFFTNCVGAISFRARLYDKDDLVNAGYPAVVTVYGTSILDEKGEPKEGTWEEAGDVYVSNRVYATLSVKIPAARDFKAVRLAVKGVDGVIAGGTPTFAPNPPLRVAIDDICIWERQSQSIAFRKAYVRPFRDATAIKGEAMVKDIAEKVEQPLVGEAFGFQAEVEVLDTEEVITGDPAHPISVDLWYYPGNDVWGFENWKTNPAAVCVKGLAPATDGDGLVFRSTVGNSASLCPPQVLEDGEGYRIVQYHLVAHYYAQGFSPGSHDLTSSEWSMPDWNTGFQDPNTTNSAFSAFTLLESIAPGRAWINEVNFCEKDDDSSKADQWVEIAVPAGVDMTGWKLRLYDMKGHLADLLTFGTTGPSMKPVPGGDPSHYDFYVVKSPFSKLASDATWERITSGSVYDGKLNYSNSYGFELVRPTGVAEHSVVVQGWNQYREAGYDFAWMYDGTNLVKVLDDLQATRGKWVWAEEDSHLVPGATVGVVTNQGALHVEWAAPMGRTPGTINEGQYIDPDWFILPNGGYVKIYSTVVGGHMRQIIGGITNTVGDLTISQGNSTSIVYEVDRWYKLGEREVKPGERSAWSGPVSKGGRTYYTLALSQVSNRIDITVSSAIADEVEAMLDPKYPEYRPAVMEWLKNGVTGNGKFRNPDGPLQPAYYLGNNPASPLAKTETNRIDLVGMYWLDLDPTSGGWELWGGMGDKPGTGKPGLGQINCDVVRTNGTDVAQIHTNILTTVWLELKNDSWKDDSGVASPLSYPPYRLQGLGNEKSDDPSFGGSWTSATFKVTMMLATDSMTLKSVWRPMRYFAFDHDSFRPADDPISPFAARVEITDPFSRQSPAWEWGWWKYAGRGLKPFSSWRLNGDITPGGVSTLKQDDYLDF